MEINIHAFNWFGLLTPLNTPSYRILYISLLIIDELQLPKAWIHIMCSTVRHEALLTFAAMQASPWHRDEMEELQKATQTPNSRPISVSHTPNSCLGFE